MLYYEFYVEAFYKDEDPDYREIKESGIVAAKNYPEAAEEITKQYGEDNIEKLTISLLSDYPPIIDAKTLKKIRESVVW